MAKIDPTFDLLPPAIRRRITTLITSYAGIEEDVFGALHGGGESAAIEALETFDRAQREKHQCDYAMIQMHDKVTRAKQEKLKVERYFPRPNIEPHASQKTPD